MNEIFSDKLSGYNFLTKSNNPTTDHMKKYGIFEWSLIRWCEQFLSFDKNFIDIGAHMGTYSIHLSHFCKNVYSFEAEQNTFYNLCGGISLNGRNNIKAYHIALGNDDKMLTLNKVSEDGGGSTLDSDIPLLSKQNVIGREIVQMKKLDSFNLDNIGFIKIDVEGWELEVLKGAKNTLERNNYPKIIFEAWPDDWYHDKKKELFDYIKDLGYSIHTISNVNNMFLATYN